MNIRKIIKTPLKEKNGIWYGPEGGYWSNLEKAKSRLYLNDLKNLGSAETMKKHFPQHQEAIFSPKRACGIATMEFSENEIIIDAGCMWGGLSVPLARTKATIIAVDQTEESLMFLAKRKEEEGLDNLYLVCADLSKIEFYDKAADKVIINGVLEWIPEKTNVEVSKFISRNNSIIDNVKSFLKDWNKNSSPYENQLEFLMKISKTLKKTGLLFLAIENRYDLSYLKGYPEPHCGIKFISLLPRKMQNLLSYLLRGRPFRSWTYSKKELTRLLKLSGFSKINFYYAFPDYRVPELILTDDGLGLYNHYLPVNKKNIYRNFISRLARKIEKLVYKKFKLSFFAPSFIIHAS